MTDRQETIIAKSIANSIVFMGILGVIFIPMLISEILIKVIL